MLNSFRFLTQFTQSPDGYMWDGEAAPNAAPTATPSATPAAATPAAPAVATPATPASATPAAATPAVPEGYVPSYRVRETREAALREAQSSFEAREAAIRAEAERYRQQVLALTGVQPPPNPEIAAVKSQFSNLYPGLSKLEEKAAMLESLIERAGDLQSQTDHYWTSYGRQTMDKLFDHASTSLGAPLTDEAKRQLHASFIGYVQSSPENTSRYANDPTIVNDFWKEFTSNFIDPARRVASAGVAGRVATALPQDTPAGIPRPAPPAPPKDMDERLTGAWERFKQLKQE